MHGAGFEPRYEKTSVHWPLQGSPNVRRNWPHSFPACFVHMMSVTWGSRLQGAHPDHQLGACIFTWLGWRISTSYCPCPFICPSSLLWYKLTRTEAVSYLLGGPQCLAHSRHLKKNDLIPRQKRRGKGESNTASVFGVNGRNTALDKYIVLCCRHSPASPPPSPCNAGSSIRGYYCCHFF